MRLVIAAVGRLREGPERALAARYADRIWPMGRRVGLGPVELRDIPEGRATSEAARRSDEAERLLARCRDARHVILLDERAKQQTTLQFAATLERLRDHDAGPVALLLGGPDGHGPAAREAAGLSMALSAMTLPHGLARIMLLEQIYRVITILSGHPYHRD